MNNDKDLEALISLNVPSQKALNEEIEARIEKMKSAQKKPKKADITDITKVDEKQLFSPQSVWLVTNLKSLTENAITGQNVDFYLAGQSGLRKMLVDGEIDGFLKGESYVKFKCVSTLGT